MKITIEKDGYNSRRWGKPWIAKVDFSENKKGEYTWGDWIGTDEGGILEIEANPGDVIAKGQKDYRKPKNSAPTFFIVQTNGNLEKVTKSEAYKHQTNKPDRKSLEAEKATLLKRLTEIEEQLKAL